MKLADHKCAACEGAVEKLSIEEINQHIQQIPGWELVQDNTIQRSFAFANFTHAMDFAKEIAAIAEQENHHPELHISWGKVRVELSTHSVGGLSINDFIEAAKISRVWEKTERGT